MEDSFLVIAALVALVLAAYLLKYAFVGAVSLFGWASEQGFIGAAAYVACWILLFPFMLVACIVAGAMVSWDQ